MGHGLVVRTPGDEACAALSSVGTFAGMARCVWSGVLRVHPPYRRQRARRGAAAVEAQHAPNPTVPDAVAAYLREVLATPAAPG